MKIAAVADVHSPKYIKEFEIALSQVDVPDVFLFAGDMVNFGMTSQYSNVIQAIDTVFATRVPIIACFGNEEFEEFRPDIRNHVRDRIVFLDGESTTIESFESKSGVIGVTAPAEQEGQFTSEGLREIYEEHARRLNRLMRKTAVDIDFLIILMHYSPLAEGPHVKDEIRYSWWFLNAIADLEPDLVIHGHLHGGDKLEVAIGKTRILNVAFPASRKVTEVIL
ncbi:MAG: metallophosphoesterase [Candidatus Thorarchaeota archaeon]